MKVKEILIFPNGNIAAFDFAGNQIPEIQKHGWFRALIETLIELEVDNLGEVVFKMPDGREAEYLEDVDSWRIK